MAWEAERVLEKRGDARRLLLSKLVVDHHLTARDPFAAGAGRAESEMADLLLSNTPVSKEKAVAYLVAQ